MPSVFGKEGKKKELIKNIGSIYDRLQKEHQISPGDFPDIKKMQEVLANQDFAKFHSLKPHLIETVDRMLATDIARLMSMIPQEESEMVSEALIKGESLRNNSPRCSIIITFHIASILHNCALSYLEFVSSEPRGASNFCASGLSASEIRKLCSRSLIRFAN